MHTHLYLRGYVGSNVSGTVLYCPRTLLMYILYSSLLRMGAYIYMWPCMSAHMQNQLLLGCFFFPFVLFLPFGDWMEDNNASENSSENIMQRGHNIMYNSPSSYLLCKNSIRKNHCCSKFKISPQSSYFAIETLNFTQILWMWYFPVQCLYLNCASNCSTTTFKITSSSNSTTSEPPSNPLVFNIHF